MKELPIVLMVLAVTSATAPCVLAQFQAAGLGNFGAGFGMNNNNGFGMNNNNGFGMNNNNNGFGMNNNNNNNGFGFGMNNDDDNNFGINSGSRFSAGRSFQGSLFEDNKDEDRFGLGGSRSFQGSLFDHNNNLNRYEPEPITRSHFGFPACKSSEECRRNADTALHSAFRSSAGDLFAGDVLLDDSTSNDYNVAVSMFRDDAKKWEEYERRTGRRPI